ncbi:hypothetical protein U9M48_014102 [Paspalum notatum var. saurae]|uniref:Uncharacterized protein n=1 Tax=Paspalum notatum var. saurae TaxID=547442 RepID=A0AAQ3T3J4_PASNO
MRCGTEAGREPGVRGGAVERRRRSGAADVDRRDGVGGEAWTEAAGREEWRRRMCGTGQGCGQGRGELPC